MLDVQRTDRSHQLVGLTHNGQIEVINDLLCARKHVINKKGWRKMRQAKNLFAFVSSPEIYQQSEMRQRVKGWCHAFKKPENFLPLLASKILLPESDFMDPMFVKDQPRNEKKLYDYFYFTVNSDAGIKHKGIHVFLDCLPILAKHNLRGLVIVYFPNSGKPNRLIVKMKQRQRHNLDHYSQTLKFHWGIMNPDQMNRAMQSCRFGFFPNTVDNSPRLITECLIRNIPILINKSIHGGWHYVSKDTGATFKKQTLSDAIDFIMTSKFEPRSYFMRHYGFEHSTRRLALFLKKIFGYNRYSHVYFSCFRKYLMQIIGS